MVRTKTIVLLLIGVVQFSCSKKESQTESKKPPQLASLVLKDTLEIPIDEATSYQNNYSQFWEDSNTLKEYYIILNKNNSRIQVYDLNSHEMVHFYQIQKSGKDGIGDHVRGFYLKNFDTLYVASGRACKILQLNKEGDVIRAYNPCDYTISSQPSSLTRAPILMNGPFLYMAAQPDVGADGNFWNHEVFLELNTLTGGVRYFFKPPPTYIGKSWGVFHHHHGFTLNDGKEVVHNFTFDQNLYVRKIADSVYTKFVSVPSQYFSEIPPWQLEPIDALNNGDEEFYITNNSYKSILWDKWRKVYYRFAERGVDLLDDNNRRRDWNDKILSVIIIDESFNVLGETDLPRNTYFIADSFITKAGLHISTNHSGNKYAHEDYFRFNVFDLKYK